MKPSRERVPTTAAVVVLVMVVDALVSLLRHGEIDIDPVGLVGFAAVTAVVAYVIWPVWWRAMTNRQT